MLPQIPIIRLPDSLDLPLPKYADGVGTSIILQAAVSEPVKIIGGQFITIPTGFACALPLGVEAQIRSLKESKKNGLVVLNAPFTIDASDREEMIVTLFNAGHNAAIIRRGQPIALLVFQAALRIQWDEITAQDVFKRERELLIEQEETYQNEQQINHLTENSSSEPLKDKNEKITFMEEEVKKIQNDADHELDKLEEINVNDIPDAYSEQALLEISPSSEKTQVRPLEQSFSENETEIEKTETSSLSFEETSQNKTQSLTKEVGEETTSQDLSTPTEQKASSSEDMIEEQLRSSLQNLPSPSETPPVEAPDFLAGMPEVTAPTIPPMPSEASEKASSPSEDVPLQEETQKELSSFPNEAKDLDVSLHPKEE